MTPQPKGTSFPMTECLLGTPTEPPLNPPMFAELQAKYCLDGKVMRLVVILKEGKSMVSI